MTDTTDDTETRMTRRDALKGGSAAAVAAGSFLLQKQLVGVASAQTNEPRIQLGLDWVIDDNPDGTGSFVIEHTPNGNAYTFGDDGTLAATTADTDDIHSETIGDETYHYAGDYPGTDPDQRFENALSDASDGDVIFMENAAYTSDHTITTTIRLFGPGSNNFGMDVQGNITWTFDSSAVFDGVLTISNDATFVFNAGRPIIRGCRMGGGTSVEINTSDALYLMNQYGDVTFGSGTSGGLIDACTGTTFTDNGSNTIGNIG